MKRRKFPWQLFAMLLLIIAAFASAEDAHGRQPRPVRQLR